MAQLFLGCLTACIGAAFIVAALIFRSEPAADFGEPPRNLILFGMLWVATGIALAAYGLVRRRSQRIPRTVCPALILATAAVAWCAYEISAGFILADRERRPYLYAFPVAFLWWLGLARGRPWAWHVSRVLAWFTACASVPIALIWIIGAGQFRDDVPAPSRRSVLAGAAALLLIGGVLLAVASSLSRASAVEYFTRRPIAADRGRWFQFQLRTLFLFVTLVAAALAFYVGYIRRYERQHAAIEFLESKGVVVRMSHLRGHQFLPTRFVGEHYGQRVESVLVRKSCDDEAIAALSHLRDLKDLTTLNFPWSPERADGIARLTSLETLTIFGDDFDHSCAQRLTQLSRLSQLSVSSQNVSPEMLRIFLQLPAIRRLYLDTENGYGFPMFLSDVRDDQLAVALPSSDIDAYLSICGEQPRVAALMLSKSEISSAALKKLNRLPLETLECYNCFLPDDALSTIATLDSLVQLRLHNSPLAATGLKRLEASPRLAKIHLLGGTVTDELAAAVTGFQGLTAVSLDSSQITDRAVEMLISLPELTTLSLRGEQLTVKTLEFLEKMPKLKEIKLDKTSIPTADLTEFLERNSHRLSPWHMVR